MTTDKHEQYIKKVWVFAILFSLVGFLLSPLAFAVSANIPPQQINPKQFPMEPDLVPYFLWTGGNVGATSTAYHFFTTVKNMGMTAAGLSKTRLRVDLRSNGSWEFEAVKNTGALIPGGAEGELWAFAITLPNSATPYVSTFEICVDALTSIFESHERNNCRLKTF
ncbi:MAG: CARDB domain-containing protein [Patescibacteria group bacterium]